MTNATIIINNLKNSYDSNGHNGSYAFKIKYYSESYNMDHYEYEEAYEYAREVFFTNCNVILKELGFNGFEISGRHGGWLKPIDKNGKTINKPIEEYISFEEFIIQEKIELAFRLIEAQFRNIKNFLKYSESLDQFNQYMERYENL